MAKNKQAAANPNQNASVATLEPTVMAPPSDQVLPQEEPKPRTFFGKEKKKLCFGTKAELDAAVHEARTKDGIAASATRKYKVTGNGKTFWVMGTRDNALGRCYLEMGGITIEELDANIKPATPASLIAALRSMTADERKQFLQNI